jgi:hypothetical protein
MGVLDAIHGSRDHEPSRRGWRAFLAGLAFLEGVGGRKKPQPRAVEANTAEERFRVEMQQIRNQVRTRAKAAVGTVLAEYPDVEQLLARLPLARLQSSSGGELARALVTIAEGVHVDKAADDVAASGDVTVSLEEIIHTVRAILRDAVTSQGETLAELLTAERSRRAQPAS